MTGVNSRMERRAADSTGLAATRRGARVKFAIRNSPLVPCMMFAVCGCHQPAGELFPPIDPPVVWPAPPETPRIKLLGTLSDSRDLKAAKSGSEILKSALRGPRPPIRFGGPHALAYHPAGILAVADSTGRAVHLIDLIHRAHTISFGAENQLVGAPVGVAWADDRLFVTDAQLHQIIELDNKGAVRQRFGE